MRYLTPNDPNAFDGYPVLDRPTYGLTNPVLCHVCKGHGGWVLKFDAFPNATLKENRHFRCFCDHCWGHGWVEKGSPNDTCEMHEWERKSVGHCMTEYKCVKCGHSQKIDSSD